jgi:hypothetical protein
VPREVPPACWITGSWPIGDDVVVNGSDWALLAWTDDRGVFVTRPRPAFYQRVFGPCVAAYSIKTPAQPGFYRLVICDQGLMPRAAIRYRVARSLRVAQPVFPARASGLSVHPVVLRAAGSGTGTFLSLTLYNTASCYVQREVFREFVDAVSQTHPGLQSRWPRARAGALVLRVAPQGVETAGPNEARELPLPCDLPPGARLNLEVPADRLPPEWADLSLRAEPAFTGVAQAEASSEEADIKIVAGRRPARFARSQFRSDAPKR